MQRRWWTVLACALAVGAAAGCQERPEATAPLPPPEPPPLIARAVLFGDPQRTNPQISPDGTKIAFLAPRDGVLNLWVAPVGGDLAAATPVTADAGRGVRRYQWAENGAHLLYLQDSGGDENWRLFSVDVATGAVLPLTPEGAQAQIVASARRLPDEALVAVNARDPAWHDVYRINVRTGARTLVERNAQRFAEYVADRDGRIRLALKRVETGAVEVWGKGEDAAWSRLFETPFEDARTFDILGFEGDGKSFLLVDSAGRDTAALLRVDAANGDRTVLGESARADVSSIWIDPVTFAPEAYATAYLRSEWTALEEQARADLGFLRERLSDEFTVVSRSADDARWIVVERGPTRPGAAHLYDRAERTLTPLFEERPALADAPLAPMIPVEIAARDGLTLVSYLTLPPGSDADGNGRPEQPLPLVLVVHGGPWSRDSFTFRPDHQWLANRGYAALSVNFRGSTGFGKAFVNAGNLEWGARMHDDLIDAVNWAIRENVAPAERVAIMGASYGGYATLAGLAFTPETFACGVSLVGPSNLETLLNSIPPYWEAIRADFARRMGDLSTAEGRALLRERSPLFKAQEIRRPLLVVQGANDPRVKRAESDQIVAALTGRTIPVTYLVYPDEGHGLSRPENRRSFNAVAEAFLGQCLGGRVEPIGQDLAGASLKVETGAGLIPGLEAALAALAPAEPVEAAAPAPN